MRYEINLEKIKNNYIKNDSLQHNAGSRISILPYTTQFKENKRYEIVNFKAAVGEFSRGITDTKEPKEFSGEKYQNDVVNKVEMDKKNRSVFINLIKEMFFEGEELTAFHPKTINYINSTPFNKKLGQFLLDVLYVEDQEAKVLINNAYRKETDNILLKLMVNNLPKLESKGACKTQYKNMVPYISSIFMEDLKYLLKNNGTLINNFEKLLKFYYVFYISQLSMIMNKTFKADIKTPIDIYFALHWEKTTKGRLSIEQGWNMVESKVLRLFSHANTLDLINHNNDNKEYSYIELKDRLDNLSTEDKKAFVEDVNELIRLYKKHIRDVNWENFKHMPMSENECYDIVNILYKSISYQFDNSDRGARQKDYGNWFVEFCKKNNFLRQRGKYRHAFNLTEEFTIFLTKICIKDKEKIKLKELFAEFKKRGVSLDNDSRARLTQLFEKINILEKKSDSGDAQYVRAIL